MSTHYINMSYKRIILFLLALIISVTSFGQDNFDDFFNQTDKFLAEYVDNDLVNYAAIQKDPTALNRLTDFIATASLLQVDVNTKISFYINSYNLTVIKSVIDYYPVESVENIKGFFKTQKHQIARELVTLDELERDILFQNYNNDPRYHFVLVCGAKGCPPLANKAYRPETLDAQIKQQTQNFLNSSSFTKIDSSSNKIQLSELFEWYKRDFEKEGTILDFINIFLKSPLSKSYSISYYSYDWSLNDMQPFEKGREKPTQNASNIRAYTPSVLLKKGQFEAKLFNNLYTQTRFFDSDRKRQDSGERSNFFAAIGQLTYGISSRFNVGLDFYFKSTSNDSPNTSPLAVFALGNDSQRRFGLTTIGPRVKYAPFSINGLSLQTTLLFPLGKGLEGDGRSTRPYIEYDGLQFFQQLLYDKSLGDFNLYGEFSLYTKIDTKKDDIPSSSFATPIKFFPSFFYGGRFSVYLMSEWAPTWGDGGISSFYLQTGIGHKFQVTEHFELEALYSNFILGKNGGAGQTFNIGMRVIY